MANAGMHAEFSISADGMGGSMRETPMPTPPVPEIFSPHQAGSELDRLLARLSTGVGETVAYGTHLLLWSAARSTGRIDEVPLLLLFRHALETVDALRCLLRPGVIEPCKMLLRGLFETVLSCEYILKADEERRALCFLAGYLHWEVDMARRLDAGSTQGRKFRRRLGKDKILHGLKLPEGQALRIREEQLEKLLRDPGLAEVEAEYHAQKQRTNRTPIWYSMYGGPRNLETLAAQVELPGLYDFLYRRWSASVHGLEVFEGKLQGRDGTRYITQLRSLDNIQPVTQHTLWLVIQLFQGYVHNRLPDMERELEDWFGREMLPLYEELARGPILQIESVFHDESRAQQRRDDAQGSRVASTRQPQAGRC
ncbi:MAG: hypothetical protein KC766_42395, partial [Myxococcales bacterium]|nr:hypothetical protein [Myxococcales bacterium]